MTLKKKNILKIIKKILKIKMINHLYKTKILKKN
jgi:hypothetical protein